MSQESCAICGGEGWVTNSFGGGNKRCPSCGGTGRRADTSDLIRDVTKTKASHHRPTNQAATKDKQTWPATYEGGQLAKEVQASTSLNDQIKARLIREIIEYEVSHGSCTQTFLKKIRKQVRPRPAG